MVHLFHYMTVSSWKHEQTADYNYDIGITNGSYTRVNYWTNYVNFANYWALLSYYINFILYFNATTVHNTNTSWWWKKHWPAVHGLPLWTIASHMDYLKLNYNAEV